VLPAPEAIILSKKTKKQTKLNEKFFRNLKEKIVQEMM